MSKFGDSRWTDDPYYEDDSCNCRLLTKSRYHTPDCPKSENQPDRNEE